MYCPRRKLWNSISKSISMLRRISGTTAVEILSGLHWYLKYWCGAHISWSKTGGAQLASVPNPGSLPAVQDAGVVVKRPVPWSYYQNAVTSSCKPTVFFKKPFRHFLSLFIDQEAYLNFVDICF